MHIIISNKTNGVLSTDLGAIPIGGSIQKNVSTDEFYKIAVNLSTLEDLGYITVVLSDNDTDRPPKYDLEVKTGGGGGGGSVTLAPIGSSPNADGATLSGSILNLEPADASFGGIITVGPQVLPGNKSFSGPITVPSLIIGTNKIAYASSFPASGSWTRGDVVYNILPIAGGSAGWSCITTGSPGVWHEFGLISLAPA